jgi:transaldolase
MTFYIDSADLDEIREAATLGVGGVTTNPTSVAKVIGHDGGTDAAYREHLGKICEFATEFPLGPVSAQVPYRKWEDMVSFGKDLVEDVSEHIVVKLPCTEEGFRAGYTLRRQVPNVRLNMTLCFSVSQAVMAANLGAFIVSPFVARSEDAGRSGLIAGIRRAYTGSPSQAYDRRPLILAASLRTTKQVEDSFCDGAGIATVSLPLLKQLVYHPQTEDGLDKFLEDWEAAKEAGAV